MNRAVMLLAVLVVSGGFMAMKAVAGEEAAGAKRCPPSQMVDVTSGETRQALQGKTLVPAFPERSAETEVVQGRDGRTMKVSSIDLLVYDTATGRLEPLAAKVTCRSSCGTSGFGSCTNSGCDATESGCTSHSCFGSSCTSGSCSKESSVEFALE